LDAAGWDAEALGFGEVLGFVEGFVEGFAEALAEALAAGELVADVLGVGV
jgi:hypothetical protein